MARTYVASIPGGTATTTVQIQGNQTLKQLVVSAVAAAAGSWELSLLSSSQIATAQPDQNVLARVRMGATAGYIALTIPISTKVSAFQNIYLHCTGAGNVGEIALS